MHTTDISLQRASGKGRAVAEGGKQGGEATLLAARKKIEAAMSSCLLMAVMVVVQLLIVFTSKHGRSVPLCLFGVPMGFGQSVWAGFNIQLHFGRRRQHASQNSSSRDSGQSKKSAVFSRKTKSQNRETVPRTHLIVVEPRRIVPGESLTVLSREKAKPLQ